MAELLLKELPVHNVENFSKFQPDCHKFSSSKKGPLYIPTHEDYPSLEIVSEKDNILLRYLHQPWERKYPRRKRDLLESRAGEEEGTTCGPPPATDSQNNSSAPQPRSKRLRPDTSSSTSGPSSLNRSNLNNSSSSASST